MERTGDESLIVAKSKRFCVCQNGYDLRVREFEPQWEMAGLPRVTMKGPVLFAVRTDIYNTKGNAQFPEGYDPAKVPDFFRVFAETSPSPEGVLAFANRFGLLGVPSENSFRIRPARNSETRKAEDADESFRTDGEPVAFWAAEITCARAALVVWSAFVARDDAALRKCFRLQDEYWVMSYPWPPETGFSGSAVYRLPPDHVDAEPLKDQWVAAKRFLMSLIKWRIFENCRPCFEPRSRSPFEYSLRVYPTSLLGFLWWQFARKVTGEVTYRPCKVCGRLIELSVTGEGHRADKEFCTNACKLKDHRQKVKEARAMKAEGRTARQIAKHFDTSMGTITKWLTKLK